MKQSINGTFINRPTQTKDKPKYKKGVNRKCNGCNKRRKPLDKSHNICRICYNSNILFKSSGNKVVDDFIRYTQINSHLEVGRMEFVPYDQFKDIKFITEGGFSKVYKATWINGPIYVLDIIKLNFKRSGSKTVALKKLNDSENITSKDLNEVQKFISFNLKYFS